MAADGTDDDSEMAAAMAEMDGEAGGDNDMAAEIDAGGRGAGLPGPGGDQAVYDVPVVISAILGTAQIPVSQLLKMGRGAVLELDRIVGDPIDIYIGKQMVGRGDVIVLEEKLGITLYDTIKTPSN